MPASLRIVEHEPLQEAEREPAKLELLFAEQAIDQKKPLPGAFTARFLAKSALDGLDQRPTNAKNRAKTGRDAMLSGLVVGVRKCAKAVGQGPGEVVRVARPLGKRSTQLLGGRPPVGDQLGRPLADWAPHAFLQIRGHREGYGPSLGSPSSTSLNW